jgi:diaminopimelate epimerase
MRVPFVKMEGAGNDYVFVDAIRDAFPFERAQELARAWSDRRFGIGSDGLIALRRGARAPVAMSMWNADGSEGAMCGNGLRCLAALAREHGHVAVDTFVVETKAGDRSVEIRRDRAGALRDVVADMGRVVVDTEPTIVTCAGHSLRVYRGDVGNPHAVCFVEGDLDSFPVEAIGAELQQHAAFPGGVNVEFVRVEPDGSLRQRTYERGSGETLACGTGATAAAVCAMQRGLVAGDEVLVRLRGGELRVARRGSSLVLAGPARTVFKGFVDVQPRA